VQLVHDILNAFFPPQAELIGDLIQGRSATVRGVAVARDLIENPLTGEPCVYYRYAVEEWRQSHATGLPGGFWRLAEHDEAIAEFYLQDTSGRAIVAPQRARIDRARGVRPARVDLGVHHRRASEILIRPGDLVEVTAIADRADDLYDDARDYRAAARRIMLRAPDDGEILIRLSESAATSP